MNPQSTPNEPTNEPVPQTQPEPNNELQQSAPAQNNFPGVESAPVSSATTVVAAQPTSRKKLFIILGVVVAAVVLLGFAVFSVWYNKPENVVSDSFMKLATAKSSEGTLSLVMPSGESSNNVAVSYVQNEANEFSGTATIKSTGSGPAIDVKGSYAVDKDQTAFVKVENLRATFDAVAKSDPSMALYAQMFDGVIDSIDNKWISISQEDLQSLNGTASDNKELSCVEGKFEEFKKSSALQKEVQSLFNKYPFIQVTQVGTETVEGVLSNHYSLKPDEAKAKDFMAGAKNLTLFKNIDGCVEEDLAKQVDESVKEKTTAEDSNATQTFDYWVGVWSHEPVKLSMKSTEDSKTTTLEFKPKLNTKPTVTIPKADKSILELQAELMTTIGDLSGDTTQPTVRDDL